MISISIIQTTILIKFYRYYSNILYYYYTEIFHCTYLNVRYTFWYGFNVSITIYGFAEIYFDICKWFKEKQIVEVTRIIIRQKKLAIIWTWSFKRLLRRKTNSLLTTFPFLSNFTFVFRICCFFSLFQLLQLSKFHRYMLQ